MTIQQIYSNTTEVDLEQLEGVDLTLKLRGEVANANDVSYIFHRAYATNGEGGAFARGLHKSNLGTRNLRDIILDVRADAIDGPNFAYGLQSMLLEGERNLNGIRLDINVSGSTRGSEDPTIGDVVITDPNDDPSFGFNNSTAYFSEFSDVIDVDVSASAGNWTNQVVAYGVRGGNSKIDKRSLEGLNPGSSLRSLRPALMTYGGNDFVEFTIEATNSGEEYEVPLSDDAAMGRQRAVGIFQAIVDLGEGDDFINISAGFTVGSNSGIGAENIRFQNDFFGGAQSAIQDESVAASVDFYESAIILGEGNDTIEFHNGWESDIWLDAGDDTLTLSAGKNLYIHGGDGDDIVNFVDDRVSYNGVDRNKNVFDTPEGSVFIDIDIEAVFIAGQEVELSSSVEGIRGTSGNDNLKGTANDDIINGLGGKDTINGKGGNDALFGGVGNDKIDGKGGDDQLAGNEGKDKLKGGNGDDYLTGNDGNDKLWGGKGDDILHGNKGNDKLYGQQGEDRFRLSRGKDKIYDFTYGEKLLVDEEFFGRSLIYTQQGEDVLVSTGTGLETLIMNVDRIDLIAAEPVEFI